MHEDNDILGVFSLHDYEHMTSAQGAAMWALFIAGLFGVYTAVSYTYPGKPSAPKEYESGLFEELGGAGAVRVSNCPDCGLMFVG